MLETLVIMPQFIVVPIVTVVLAVLAYFFIWPIDAKFGDHGFHNTYMGGPRIFGLIFAAGAAVMLIISVVMLIPFDSKYHVYHRLSGVIHVDTNTFDNGSGELTEGLVVYRVDGYENQIGSSDARLITLEGQNVDLTCSLEWRPYDADVTWCKFAGLNK